MSVAATALVPPAAASASETGGSGAAAACQASPGVTRSSNGAQIVFSGFFRCDTNYEKTVIISAYSGTPDLQSYRGGQTVKPNCGYGYTCYGDPPYYLPDAPGDQTYCTVISARQINEPWTEAKYCRVL